jgi:hypothetical protein
MVTRCVSTRLRGERCELDAGHTGAHISGLAPGRNLICGWSNRDDPTLASLDAEQEREQSVLDGFTVDQGVSMT